MSKSIEEKLDIMYEAFVERYVKADQGHTIAIATKANPEITSSYAEQVIAYDRIIDSIEAEDKELADDLLTEIHSRLQA